MAFLIISGGFIDQQAPIGGQIGVVQIHDSITGKIKYRIRYLPPTQFGHSFREDVLEVAQHGSKLPDHIGSAILREIGESCEIGYS